jgi:tape measure domain-containing protein
MEVDPVILQLRADVDRYLATVQSTTRKVDEQLGRQEKSARKLEAEMKRSSGAISGHLKGIAGTLATYFTGQELVGLLDSFTRLQNNLRVAGLEGQKLGAVQSQLFGIAQKYGVELEGLSGLFGKVTQSQKELGASQNEVVRLTGLTAAALKITGVSSAQSAGAILGLSQAFASGKVKAEEYNQILEGGLQPLLQAVANSERFGGSLGKLRQAVVDGKVSSQEFFALILQGANDLEAKAAKSVLTLSGGFTTLTNALTVYFGEADKANGVSAALGSAFEKLAENLDVIIPAIAIVATAMGVRYVVAALAATAANVRLAASATGAASSMGVLGAATFALQARLAGAATTSQALGFALSAIGKGGLVTAAILAIGGAMYYLAQSQEYGGQAARDLTDQINQQAEKFGLATGKIREANAATNDLTAAERTALVATANLTGQANLLSEAWARVAAQAKSAAIEQAQAEFDGARTRRVAADAAYERDRQSGTFLGFRLSSAGADPNRKLLAQADLAAQNEAAAKRNLDSIRNKPLTRIAPTATAPIATGGTKPGGSKPSGTSGPSGPSATEINQRFLNEMAGYAQQALSAQASLAQSAEERAEIELRMVELARTRTLDGINQEKDYNAVQKQRLTNQVEALAELERERIGRDAKRQLEQEAQQLADEEYRVNSDALRIQFDIADTQGERKQLALEMLELEQRYQESLLEAVIASETASEAEKKRAQYALESLRRLAPERSAQTDRQNETAAEKYIRGLTQTSGQINDAIDGIKIEGLDALNDGLVDAITGARSLGDVFKSVASQIIGDLLRIAIQQAVIKPLAESLFSSGGSSGGAASAIGSAIGSIFGRASGGPVAPGQFYRVNENATPGRVEGFMSRDGGSIIPLGKMDALRGGGQSGGVVRIMIEEAAGFASTVRTEATGVAIEVVRATAPTIIDAAKQATLAAAGRPKL